MEVTYTKTIATGRDQNDFYPTPPLVTRALLDVEDFSDPILEPCAGDGDMVREILDQEYNVVSNELFPRPGFTPDFTENFLNVDLDMFGCNSLVANPPYKIVNNFIMHALKSKIKKHAWLVRLHFLESARRYVNIFKTDPPNRVYVFPMRMQVSTWGIEKGPYGGMIPYCWVVWERCRSARNSTELKWFDPTRVEFINKYPDKCGTDNKNSY